MTRSMSAFCSRPRPPQAGQAPNGLLKENSRGSISEMVKPDTGQANFSENMMRLASDAAAVASLVSLAAFASPRTRGEGGWPPLRESELVKAPPHPDPLLARGKREKKPARPRIPPRRCRRRA